ncbi:MAG: PPC domain-containing protein [Gemmataceae bacterium]
MRMHSRTTSQVRRNGPARLGVEPLEARTLLSVGWMGPSLASDAEPNDTALLARDFGTLRTGARPLATGTVGDGAAGAADVDWYRFILPEPARVTVGTLGSSSGDAVRAVLSLYNESLINLPVQDVARQDGTATLTRDLPAGTYYVAVSGFGNRYFHPLLACSGYQGETGDYSLVVTIAPLDALPAWSGCPRSRQTPPKRGWGNSRTTPRRPLMNWAT